MADSLRGLRIGGPCATGPSKMSSQYRQSEFPPQALDAIFARVKDKPRFVEEHDSWAGVFSAVDAGTGVAIVSDAFHYAFGGRVKLLPLTPEPNAFQSGDRFARERHSAVTTKRCGCCRRTIEPL
jgi:hypothetical protein